MSTKPGDGEASASPSSSFRGSRRRAGTWPSEDASTPQQRRRNATEVVLRMLTARERSEAEVRRALSKRGYDPDTIAVVVQEFISKNLLSDARFAEAFAEEAAQRRGYGAAAIRFKLRGKGVSPELAARAAAVSPEDEEERARELAAKKVRAMTALSPDVRYRRLAGALARRGYPADIVSRVAADLSRHEPRAPGDE
ncbi:MAG TPA: regulatory protein RecX [Actinomycetota bacterium]|nr:regulatory protein RecX [Actinomycetota bacterium]